MSVSVQQVEHLISQGRYLEARNLAELGFSSTDNTLRYQQLYALALSKSGIPQTAADFLLPIYHQHSNDPETAGILGGIYKELFKHNQDSKFAVLSRDTYARNFEQTKNYYTGINAATMSAIAGKMQKGREIAAEVIALLKEETQDYWELATLAEANLLVKNRAKAIDLYFKAKQVAGTDWGKINSVHNQLWLLNHYVPVPSEVIKVFGPPEVVAFVGHMIDHPARSKPRFPAAIETEIQREISYAIKSVNAKIGYCSLACGADILFAEEMISQGAELNVFMPFSKSDFVDISLKFAGDVWVHRFEKILEGRNVNYLTHDDYHGNDELFSLQSRIIFGSAILRSKLLHGKASLVSVLSEVDMNSKTGGTRETIKLWPYTDRVHNINPDRFIREEHIKVSAHTDLSTSSDFVEKQQSTKVVSYICNLQFNNMNAAEISEVWNQLLSEMIDLNLTLNAYSIRDNYLLVLLNSSHSCIDAALEIVSRSGLNDVKVSFDTGPAEVNEMESDKKAKISGEAIQLVEEINAYALPGRMICTANFAAVAVLSQDLYKLLHSGVIKLNSSVKNCELYQIERV